MFIDVTRHGGERALRLAVAAIALLDEAPGGTAIRLIGGDSLHVVDTPAEIETRCMPQMIFAESVLSEDDVAAITAAPTGAVIPLGPGTAESAMPKGKRK
ncbi:hypothetical protein [Sphingomonas sp. UYP23]